MAGTIVWTGNAVVTVGGESTEIYMWPQPASQWNKQDVASGAFGFPQIAWSKLDKLKARGRR